MTDALLRARNVARRFGSQVALEPTEIDVRAGETLALIGPNGAGKSTLLSILAGALVALPLLAAGRAMWEFFSERITLEPWEEGGPPPVEVELDEKTPAAERPVRAGGPAGPDEEAAAAQS